MWLANRWLITGVKCSLMRPSTGTLCTNRARTSVLSHGLPPSSSGPQLHGLEMSPILRQGQGPQGPLGTMMELKRIMIWLMCLISSLEEAELHDQYRLKNCGFILFCCYRFPFLFVSHFDRLGLYVSVFSICYLIVIDLNLMLLLSVFVISLLLTWPLLAYCRTIALLWFVCIKKTKQKKIGPCVLFPFHSCAFCSFDKV